MKNVKWTVLKNKPFVISMGPMPTELARAIMATATKGGCVRVNMANGFNGHISSIYASARKHGLQAHSRMDKLDKVVYYWTTKKAK